MITQFFRFTKSLVGVGLLLAFALACGGSGNTPPPPPASTITSVMVSPSSATITTGASQQFAATVSGTYNPSQSVTWSVTGGNITSSGLYTAPNTVNTYIITAKSVQDPGKAGTAVVVVSQPVTVQLTPSPATTTVNRTIYFHATVSGVANPSLLWQVVSEGQANINDGYFYTAYPGNYRIRATYQPSGQFAESDIAVGTIETGPGTDLNGNGVRDDVDALINSWNLSSAQKSTLTGVAQQAQSMVLLGASGNPNAYTAYTLAQNMDSGMISLSASLPTYQSYVGSVLANTLNTQDRSYAYIAFEKAIGGRYFPSQATTIAPFQPSGDQAIQAQSNVWASGYQVFFLNGIDNTKLQALGSMMDLRGAVGQTYNGESVQTGLLFNPTDGWLTDLAEAFKQKAQVDSRILGRWDLFWSAVLLIDTGDPSTIIIKDLVLADTLAYLQTKINGTNPSYWVQQFKDVVQAKLVEGFKVVIVAHSQGNLFASSVYRAALAAHPEYANSIKVVHVAAVNGQADLVGPYWNADCDKVVIGLRSTLDPTIPSPDIYYPTGTTLCVYQPPFISYPPCDFWGHNFSSIYMNSIFPGRGNILGSVQNAMSSMVAPPTPGPGIFAVTGPMPYGSDRTTSYLYFVIPTAGGTDTQIGPITFNGNSTQLTDITLTPDGTLYGTSNSHLYQLDKTTGGATEIGTGYLDPWVNALASDSSGNLFCGGQDGAFGSLNRTNGSYTLIGNYDGYSSSGDLAFSPVNILYATVVSAFSTNDQLATLNINTGHATPVNASFDTGVRGIYGLRFVGNQLFGFSADFDGKGSIWTIDTNTGIATFVRKTQFAVFGALRSKNVPNPNTGTVKNAAK